MRIQSLTRHAGVSFNGGPGYVHLQAANADSRVLRSAWDAVVAQTGLGEPLQLSEEGRSDGVVHGLARIFPFLALSSLASALKATYAGRALPKALADELALAAADARMFDASYGRHFREAERRGWVVQSLRLGFYPTLLVGAGRHAHLLIMNLPERVTAPITLAGINKAMARDLLAAHGLPVANGSLAGSPNAALRAAKRVGGPVVIKRLIGGNSDGVIVGVSESRDVTSAAKLLLAGNHAVLVEAAVPGVELRLHFLGGKLHRAFRAEPYFVTGDGERSLAALIGERYPRYLQVMSGSSVHRRRLVMCLWSLGVRALDDLDRIVPAAGRVIRISAATGGGMQPVRPEDFIPKSDIARLERFLKHHGSPSCGMDLIVRTPGASLDESCVILELNVPCGFGYLDDPDAAVAADLEAAISDDPTFRRDKGRVPVWLVMAEDGPAAARRAERALRTRYERVIVDSLAIDETNWIALLNRSDADAFLIVVSEQSIRAHGIPVNLAPVLIREANPSEFAKRFPVTSQTVKHAKGKTSALRAPDKTRV